MKTIISNIVHITFLDCDSLISGIPCEDLANQSKMMTFPVS